MKTDRRGRDAGGMLAAALFILVALAALWDTTTMADPDSYVFPRTVATAMIIFCLLYLVWQWLAPSPGEGEVLPGASTPRRVGLVIALLAAVGLMPWFGFLVSGILVFGSIMLLAMYDPWTRYRRVVFPLVGLATVIAFYYLFAKLLLVPLPVGTFFE